MAELAKRFVCEGLLEEGGFVTVYCCDGGVLSIAFEIAGERVSSRVKKVSGTVGSSATVGVSKDLPF